MNEISLTADAINKNHYIDRTTTTPTQSKKPTFTPLKYRGHMLEILSVLSECGGMNIREISNKTLLSKNLIRVYCNRGQNSKILVKVECWGWAISDRGIMLLNSTTTTTTTTHNTNITQTQHKHNTNITLNPSSQLNSSINRQLKTNTRCQSAIKQLDLSDFLQREDITQVGRVVVGVLADHYERTGEKFRIFQDEYDLADQLDISLAEVRPTLALLKEEGCIYVRREALGWKIGLKVAFVEMLQYA